MELLLTPAFAAISPDAKSSGQDMTHLDSEMIEMVLLLPRWQALALQSAAKQRGMSSGQMLRRMIGATFGTQPPLVSS